MLNSKLDIEIINFCKKNDIITKTEEIKQTEKYLFTISKEKSILKNARLLDIVQEKIFKKYPDIWKF